MRVDFRLAYPLVVLLLLTSARASAGMDTLAHTVERLKSGDSTNHVNLLHNFNWLVSFKDKQGKLHEVQTRRPDSLFTSNAPDTVHFSAAFYVTPDLANKLLSLHYNLDGSLLLILNGQAIVRTGDFQPDREDRTHLFTLDNYTDFLFGDSVQKMELVYLPYSQARVYNLQLALEKRKVAEAYQQKIAKENSESYGMGFYYLAFGIVFLILFIFSRERSENLYFALFCIFAALAYLWGEVELPFHFRSNVLYNLENFFGIFSFEFLSMFFCKIVMGREKSRIPISIMAAAMALCFLPVIRYNYISIGGGAVPMLLGLVYGTLYIYVAVAIIYFLIRGVGKKQWEARAVLVFCFVPLLLFVLLLVLFIIASAIKGSNQGLNELFSMLLHYFTRAIVFIYPLAGVFILGKRNGMNQLKLVAQVTSIQRLSEENMAREKEKQELLENQKDSLEREVVLRTAEIMVQKEEIERQHSELKVEKQKSDDLLRNILPAEVAEELKEKGFSEAKLFDNVTVLFADFVDFTRAGESLTPQELVSELHICFKAFDETISRYNIEKIKTIGDAYLAVCGLPVSDPRHAEHVVSAALEICTFMKQRQAQMGNRTFKVRLGVHSGSVVAGIVGVKKFAYDIWGDTVNTAARMEQSSEGDKINISHTTFELVKNKFKCTYRGEIDAKNKGQLKMYFVDGAISA